MVLWIPPLPVTYYACKTLKFKQPTFRLLDGVILLNQRTGSWTHMLIMLPTGINRSKFTAHLIQDSVCVSHGVFRTRLHCSPYSSWDLIHQTCPLQWRHNDHDGISNHQPHGCLLNHLFRPRSKKTSKLRVAGLCVEFTGTGEFPAQRVSYAENVSIWWRHHAMPLSTKWYGHLGKPRSHEIWVKFMQSFWHLTDARQAPIRF